MRALAVAVALVVAGLACKQDPAQQPGAPSDGGLICTELYAYGITVEVTDAAGRVIGDATVTIRDGTYSETLQAFPSGGYVGAGERAGTYEVSVAKAGYRTHSETVTVTADKCHVKGVRLAVKLQTGT